MSDQLSAAVRALRLSRGGDSRTARATEERVLARVARQSRRTQRRHWLLPIAAVLAVSSGWAATRPRVQHDVRAWWHRLATPAPPPARPGAWLVPPVSSAATAAALATPAPSTPAHAATSPASTTPPATSERPPSRPQRLEASTALLPPPSATPTAERTTSLQLYQTAHELHFRKQDFGAALTAWDAYLASAATGPLGLEARYNRAICLTRLGRSSEARSALLPFARGDYGGYRQAEANALSNGSAGAAP